MVELGDADSASIDVGDLGQVLDGLLTVGTAILVAVRCARSSSPAGPGCALRRWRSSSRARSCSRRPRCSIPSRSSPFWRRSPSSSAPRMLRDRRYGIGAVVVLGLVVGAGQLVRSAGPLGVSVSSASRCSSSPSPTKWSVAQLCGRSVIVGVLGALIALPWYVYLHSRYSNPVFGRRRLRRPVDVPSARARALRCACRVSARRGGPGLPSQRLWFYVDPGLPDVITGPHRGKLAPAFWPSSTPTPGATSSGTGTGARPRSR